MSDNILVSNSSSLKKPTAATFLSFFPHSRCWLVCPYSHWWNCNLPAQTQLHQWALITLHPPGYKDMHSCCSVAQKLNVISGIPPFYKQDSVTGRTEKQLKPPNLIFPISTWALYTVTMHPFSGAHPSNESSDVIEIVKTGCKELHNCTFPIGWPSYYWVFSIIFPITGDWPKPLFNQCIPSYELCNIKITLLDAAHLVWKPYVESC